MERFKRLLTIVVVSCLSIVMLSPVVDAQTRWQDEWPEEWPELPAALPDFPELTEAYSRGSRALEKLGHRLPAVARSHGLEIAQLRSMLDTDRTLFVDGTGQLVYFDELAPSGPAPTIGQAEAGTPPATGPAFELASRPGAAKTIFLDFNGHVTEGTTWNTQNQISSIVSGAYDTDGNAGSWSDAELDVIIRSWLVVAEDFAPWDVNVTTIDPGPEALRRTSASDPFWGSRVVITQDNVVNCGCGGAAYIGSFDDVFDEPAFVFNTNFVGVSEAISHEVGHAMGLAHDGSTTSGYYRGHDAPGTVGWAPIMGSSYWEPLTQWSQQEFTGASNTDTSANFGGGSDDIAIISSLTNGNNFGLIADDHGDTVGSATTITDFAVPVQGLIGTRQDRDIFAFTTSGGQFDLSATPAPIGPNLDISLTLRDSSGAVVGSANPAEALDAALSAQLSPGNYTIEIDGVGVGDPAAATPSGYTDYGSIGRYTLTMLTTEIAVAMVPGDVNCDGRSTVADALFVSQYAVGNRSEATQCPLEDPANEIYTATADVNENGRISVGDALLISQCSVGLPNEFCPDDQPE